MVLRLGQGGDTAVHEHLHDPHPLLLWVQRRGSRSGLLKQGAYDDAVAIFVVSDLHDAANALQDTVPAGSTLLLLGDLLNLIDYSDMSGILTEIFTTETVLTINELRASNDHEHAREVMRSRSAGREQEIQERMEARVDEQYASVFAALPDPTYLILGNVDRPDVVARYVAKSPNVTWPDGKIVELEGERFGFIGGALPTPLHVSGEISREEMASKVESLGEVDVLCSHVPPAIPELCYDTRARRSEEGSADLLHYIEDVQPRVAYFGHVHQPLISSIHIGRTWCVNVGYFRATLRPFPHHAGQTER
jgi:Icc-related predicted phosphoesterase